MIKLNISSETDLKLFDEGESSIYIYIFNQFYNCLSVIIVYSYVILRLNIFILLLMIELNISYETYLNLFEVLSNVR